MSDARLSIVNEPNKSFDMLIVDAFSSDSIPIHLITLEAIELYLKKLKDNGIWLVDVSVMALYNQGKKPARTKYQELVKISWDNYTLDVIREAKPKNVIIVGKGVAEIVCQDLKKLLGENCHVINQPNARLSSKARLEEHSKCWEICHS